MLVWFGLWGLSGWIIVLVLSLLWRGKRNERAVERDWNLLMRPRGERAVVAVSERFSNELDLVSFAYDRAFRARQLGSIQEAITFLEIGAQMAEEFAPSLLRMLGALGNLARMVGAIAPVRPLRPPDFRLTSVVHVAHLHAFLHHLCVGAEERLRLRAKMLSVCVRAASSYLVRASRRATQEGGARDWRDVEEGHHDLKALTRESIETFRALILSMDAQRRDDTSAA